MADSPKLSAKEQIILRMMINTNKEMYGLQMVKDSGGQLRRWTIYVTLNRMEEKGLITSRVEDHADETRGIYRRLYKPTEMGRRRIVGLNRSESN